MRPDLMVVERYSNIVLEALKEARGVKLKDIVKDRVKNKKAEMINDVLRTRIDDMLTLSKELYEMKKKLLGTNCFALELELVTPGLVGIGSGPFKAVFEVGLNIDPVLGLPYYPGSGIKGAVRGFVENYFEGDKGLIDRLFGNNEESSAITFLDMYPIGLNGNSLFKGLVMNPHYYREGKPVKDELDVNPIPVQYLGISEGTIFGLIACLKVERLEELQPLLKSNMWKGKMKDIVKSISKSNEFTDTKMLKLIAIITIATLKKGIAARSAKGFNFFEVFNEKLTFKPKSMKVGR